MRVGDLVKFEPEETDLMKDKRRVGTIVTVSTYQGGRLQRRQHDEPILEVLWNTGALGWILKRRVEVINENS